MFCLLAHNQPFDTGLQCRQECHLRFCQISSGRRLSLHWAPWWWWWPKSRERRPCSLPPSCCYNRCQWVPAAFLYQYHPIIDWRSGLPRYKKEILKDLLSNNSFSLRNVIYVISSSEHRINSTKRTSKALTLTTPVLSLLEKAIAFWISLRLLWEQKSIKSRLPLHFMTLSLFDQ